jgi:TRAP-type C4-dicarboxylate transport system substrate-binding protein
MREWVCAAWLMTVWAGAAPTAHAQTARAQNTEVIVGATTFPGTITDDQWKVFTGNIERNASPPMALKMMIRGELGPEEAMVAAMRRGRIQISGTSSTGASQLVPELAVLSLPFLFDSADQFDELLEGELRAAVAALFAARGVEFIHWVDSNSVGVYGKDLLADPARIRDYKLRTPSSISAQVTAQVLRADAVYIPYPDIVPSLQTGLIKGGLTSDFAFFTGGLNAESPYFIYTRHAHDVGVLVANKAWFGALGPASQNAVRTAWGDGIEFRRRVRANTAAEMAKLPAKGTQVVELTAEQRARWVGATKPVHAMVLEQLGPDARALYDAIIAAKAKY